MNIEKPENTALAITVELWNSFLNIENLHPSDKAEFQHHLHCIQNLLYAHKYKVEVESNGMYKG